MQFFRFPILFLLAFFLHLPALAGVIVLENRSDEPVVLALGAEEDVKVELAPLEVKAFRTNGTVQCRYQTKRGPQQYQLQPNELYAYQRDALGRQLLQAVSFPEPDEAVGPPPEALPATDKPGRATIRVKLYVDDENPRRANSLTADLRRRLQSASDAIAKACGVRFEMVAVDRWESDNALAEPAALLKDFQDKVAVEPGELAIGFTSQLAAPHNAVYQAELPPPLESHLLVRDWEKGSTEGERVAILAQQLAGWLGAELSPEQATLMRPLAGRAAPLKREYALRIDGPNVLAMNLVAEQLQNRGVTAWEQIDAATAKRLRQVRFGLKQARSILAQGHRRGTRRAPQETEDRYAVMFADGTTLSGRQIEKWNAQFTAATVAGIPIFRSSVPVRWIRLNGVGEQVTPESFVELLGGDRLPGTVAEYLPDEAAGVQRVEQLRVVPSIELQLPGGSAGTPLNIVLSQVRRIVRDGAPRRFEGNIAWWGDGETFQFDTVRFAADGVELQKDETRKKVTWQELSELQLAPDREWPSHLQTLARINPRLDGPLVNAESLDGARLTGAVSAVRTEAVGGVIYQSVQPAWAATPLWLPAPRVRLYTFFQPTELPLTRLSPVAVRQRGFVASPVPWQRDANTAGGRLNGGGYEFAWGLGTQSYSELHFALPPPSVGFRSWVGLDRSVGDGGCAQSRIAVGPAVQKLLFTSRLFVGSSEIQDIGQIKLPRPSDAAQRSAQRLVLITDPAIKNRPAGADPFEIRDLLNWLEPMLLLDREELAAAVQAAR